MIGDVDELAGSFLGGEVSSGLIVLRNLAPSEHWHESPSTSRSPFEVDAEPGVAGLGADGAADANLQEPAANPPLADVVAAPPRSRA
jgi:hypothetical protein